MSNQTNIKSTKQLAWKLGLVKKRKSTTDHASKRMRRTFQPYAYLIIIDFESTCWDDKKYRSQEIIEFPAVLLNTASGEIEEEFHYYVQPIENPILSEFCKTLTGITQAQVEEGIPILNCLKRFSNWLNKLKRTKNMTFGLPTGSRSDHTLCTFVTWSDWDLGVCLQYECRRKQLLKPSELNSWIDLRATYRKFYDRKPEGLNGALKDLGIVFEGREHSGLHDSRNTATLAWRMMCDGCLLNVTKTLPQAGGPRLPPMSAGLGKNNNTKDQQSEKPVSILAKPTAKQSDALPKPVSVSSTPVLSVSTTLGTSEPPASKTSNFTGIKPPTVSTICKPCPVSKPSQPTLTAGASKVGSSSSGGSLSAAAVTSSVAGAAVASSIAGAAVASKPVAKPGTALTTKVHASVGQRGVVTKPQITVQNNTKTVEQTTAATIPPSNNCINNKPVRSTMSSKLTSPAMKFNVKDHVGPCRPSLGASPMLRSDSMPHNIRQPKTAMANAGVPITAGSHTALLSKTNKENTGYHTRKYIPVNGMNCNFNSSNSNASPLDCKPSTLKPQTSPVLFKIPTPPAASLVRRSSDVTTKANAPFKVPTPPGTGRNGLHNVSNVSWLGSGLSNRTPVNQNLSNISLNSSSDMHRTAPLCDCGRRTKRRVVQAPGANQGRAFYCCTLGRGTAGSTGQSSRKNKSGCKYFQWESPSGKNGGNQSMNSSSNSFWNKHRNSSMNSTMNSSWNNSNIGSFNRSVSWSGYSSHSSSYTKNCPAPSPSDDFLGRPPCPKPNDNRNSFKSPDIISISPPEYRSPDLLNDSYSSLDHFPLLPPDAFSDPDKT